MLAVMGSAIAAMVVVAALLGGIAQTIVIAQYGNGSIPAQITDDKTGRLLAARQEGPTVYGWLYVRHAVDGNDPSARN